MDKPNFLRKFCIVGLGSTEELKEDLKEAKRLKSK